MFRTGEVDFKTLDFIVNYYDTDFFELLPNHIIISKTSVFIFAFGLWYTLPDTNDAVVNKLGVIYFFSSIHPHLGMVQGLVEPEKKSKHSDF